MTTTSILERVPVEAVAAQARSLRPGAVLVALVTGFFWLIGFGSAKLFGAAWLSVGWAYSATRTGWDEARGPSKRQQINRLEQQVIELSAALARA